MPAFEILMELKLRILIGLVIGSLIMTTTGVRIGVRTRSLIKGLINRKYGYSLYYKATYSKQQLHPLYNQVSVISIISQLITIGRFKWALAPPYCGLILIKRQELANCILLLSSLLRSIIQEGLIVSRYYQFRLPLSLGPRNSATPRTRSPYQNRCPLFKPTYIHQIQTFYYAI